MDQLHKVPYDAVLFLKCFNILSLLFTSSKLENNGNMVMLARPKTGFEQGGGVRLVNEVSLSSLFMCSVETFEFVFNFFQSGVGIQVLSLWEDGEPLSTPP